jgi:hypothetical protein
MKSFFPYRQTIELDETYNNKYLQYEVYLHGDVIYKGKTFVLNNQTTIDFTNVINNYVYRTSYKYQQQFYQPDRTVNLPINLEPNEYDNEIVNTNIEVSLLYLGSEIMNFTFDISIYFKDVNIPNNQSNMVDTYQYSVIENHIPYISTNKYWLGLNYGVSHIETTVPILRIDNNNQCKLNTSIIGNYIYHIPLNQLYSNLFINTDSTLVDTLIGYETVDYVWGGSATEIGTYPTTVLGANINTSNIRPLNADEKIYLDYQYSVNKQWQYQATNNLIAIVDKCSDKWYIQWRDKNGWHSVGLMNVEVIQDKTNITIENIYHENVVANNRIRKRFNIKSKRLSNDELSEYALMLESPYIWLYSVENDTSYCCTIDTNTTNYIPNKNVKHFTIEITEIIQH